MATRIDTILRQNDARTDAREWQSYSTVMLASSLDLPPRTRQVSSSSAVKTSQPAETSLFSTPVPRLHEASSSASAAAEPSHATTALNSNGPRGGLTYGMVAGMVVGSLLATVIVVSLTCIWYQERRRKRKRRAWGRTRSCTSPLAAPAVTFAPLSTATFAPPPSPPPPADNLVPTDTFSAAPDRLVTPDPNAWLPRHEDVAWDPRDSESSTGFRSPTPRPAVAEVRSFTRAGRKPRMYDVATSKLGEGEKVIFDEAGGVTSRAGKNDKAS